MFADADSSLENASYVLVGAPLDHTTTHRAGTREAPERIREASHSYDSYVHRTNQDLAEVPIHDYGDLDVWHPTNETIEFAADIIHDFRTENKTPVIIGGEHTVSVAGWRGTEPDAFVVLDAHLDLKTEFKGTEFGHSSVSKLAIKDDLPVVIGGVRSGSKDEFRYARNNDGVSFHDPKSLNAFLDTATEYENPYISIDLDAVDPGYAPGVGTPEPYGLRPPQVRRVLEELSANSVGFDVVEVCPPHDSGETAYLAAQFVRDYIAESSE